MLLTSAEIGDGEKHCAAVPRESTAKRLIHQTLLYHPPAGP